MVTPTSPGHRASCRPRAALGRRAICLIGLCLLHGCATEPAKSPHPQRPLAESRAVELIARAVSDERLTPTTGRLVSLPRERALQVDVAVAGRQLAIAFVTAPERTALGSAIPAHDVGSNALSLVRDPNHPDTRILILHDLGYMTDEQEGEEREVTSVMVERRLQRDVKDFLATARRQGWP